MCVRKDALSTRQEWTVKLVLCGADLGAADSVLRLVKLTPRYRRAFFLRALLVPLRLRSDDDEEEIDLCFETRKLILDL